MSRPTPHSRAVRTKSKPPAGRNTTASPGGGYILASDHSLHDRIPVENIVEMFRVGAEYGGKVYKNE
jgi:hypothetical protein